MDLNVCQDVNCLKDGAYLAGTGCACITSQGSLFTSISSTHAITLIFHQKHEHRGPWAERETSIYPPKPQPQMYHLQR